MIRAAFIGTGQRSVSHMVAIQQMADVEVAALVDLEEARAQAARDRANQRLPNGAKPIHARFFTDYRRMLEETAPDRVYLCLPPFVHGETMKP